MISEMFNEGKVLMYKMLVVEAEMCHDVNILTEKAELMRNLRVGIEEMGEFPH